ncbi:MAG: MBOAT family protein [Ignavibacteriae bacterium]|nr:MBOAT family protein [Ignavibacteriota bacterium]
MFLYKYINLLTDNLLGFTNLMGWNYGKPALILLIPAGLSFYIFKSITYLIETGRGNIINIKFVNAALYISYFPAIMAGPIDKPNNLINQFDRKVSFDYERVTDSLKIILWGFFSKVVIADRLSPVTSRIFSDLNSYNGIYMVIGVLLFTVQIYCDFSGYSYIAYGFSKFIGIDVINNFKRPYLSKSIAEFWKRWHISLSKWLQEYIFLPLSYSIARILMERKINIRIDYASYIIASLITMIVCGLWHGANITFAIWGLYFGILLVLSLLFKKTRRALKSKFHINNANPFISLSKIMFTFLLVSISWIFFKSDTLKEIGQIFSNIFSWSGIINNSNGSGIIKNILKTYGLSYKELYLSIVFIAVLLTVDILQERFNIFERIKKQNKLIRWSLYYALLISVIFFGAYNSQQGFIYQQF